MDYGPPSCILHLLHKAASPDKDLYTCDLNKLCRLDIHHPECIQDEEWTVLRHVVKAEGLKNNREKKEE